MNKIHKLTPEALMQIFKVHTEAEVFKPVDIIELMRNDEVIYQVKIIGINHDIDENGKVIPLTVAPLEMPGRKAMHKDWRKSKGDYAQTDVRAYLNGEYYDALPDELKALIIPTVKKTKTYNGKEVTTADNIFLPSEFEMHGRIIYSDRVDDDKQYAAFKTWRGRVQNVEGEDYATSFLTRSPYSGYSTGWCYVDSTAGANNSNAYNRYAVCPCFGIGVSE